MSYLRYLCLFAHSVVQNIRVVFLFCFSSSCVPYVANFSGLSFFDLPFRQLLPYPLFRVAHIFIFCLIFVFALFYFLCVCLVTNATCVSGLSILN